MRLLPGLASAVFLALIFAFLVRVEPELGYASRKKYENVLNAFQTAERMQIESNVVFQIFEAFAQLRVTIFAQHEAMFLPEYRSPLIQHEFCEHDLIIVETDERGNTLRFNNLAGKINEEFACYMAKISTIYKITNNSRIFFGPENQEDRERANNLFRELIGNTGDSIDVVAFKATRLSTYVDSGRFSGFYWDHLTLENGNNIYFYCRLNLDIYEESYALKRAMSKYNSPGMSCVYYDKSSSEFVGEDFLSDKLPARLADKIRFYFKQTAGAGNEADSVVFHTIRLGKDLAVIGRSVAGSQYIPVVITAIDEQKPFTLADSRIVLIFAILCVGVYIFIQTVVFDRGLGLSVGKMLIVSCLLAISMPFLMGVSIFRLILQETLQSENLKLETEIHKVITGIDSGVRLFNANLFQSFMRQMNREEAIKKLKQFQREQAQCARSGKLENVEKDPTGASDFVVGVSQSAFAPFSDGLYEEEDLGRLRNAILLMGPDGFKRYVDRFSEKVSGYRSGEDTNPIINLMNMYMRSIEPFFPSNSFAEGLSSEAQKKNTAGFVASDLLIEEGKNQVIGTLGKHNFFEIFANFDGLNQLRMSIGTTNFIVFPMYLNGVIEFFGGIAWDEFNISEIYLKIVFNNLKELAKNTAKTVEAEKKQERSIFSHIDPAYYFAKEPVFLQSMGGVTGNNIYSGNIENPKLGSMIRASAHNKRHEKLISSGEDSAIYKVLPGRFFTLYTIGARQSRSHMDQTEYWRTVIFSLGLVIFILFAVLAAVNISRSFTGPLDHLLWGLGMIARNNYQVKLKDSREDEFGSISRAFNFMTKRLREKDTLGKFVSESVKKIASDPVLLEKAQRGSEAEVTIVFADLDGFSRFYESAQQQEIQDKIEFVFENFFMLAEELGGEVDKVMGEKLLIVFSHVRLGRKNAAIAATRLAGKMLQLLKTDKHLNPVFGINSGKVIQGIIGTPAVRMDNTVIGDPVNVAARLCSLADGKTMPVIISGQVREILGNKVKTQRIEVERIRGKRQEVEVFNLIL